MADVIINSLSGRLEGIYKQSKLLKAHCALLLHPHPLHGGNMHNKIVFLMEKVLVENGFSTLRFNFAGVGKSEGEPFSEGREEIIDASTCFDWLKEKEPDASSFWVAGFSFGAYIALQIMMRRIEINRFISIGTPANMFDLGFLYPCPTDGLFVHGEKDTIAPYKDADKIIKKSARTKERRIDVSVIKNADHFFTSHMDSLEKTLNNYVVKELKRGIVQKISI